MLKTEVTNSLRGSMLMERLQKSKTVNTVKRRYTFTDPANLKQHPKKSCMKDEKANDAEWWDKFEQGGFDGYHSKGW
jgi:hypothetical protein